MNETSRQEEAAEAAIERARELNERGDLQAAEAAYREAAGAGRIDALYELGSLLMRRDDYDAAAAAYEEAWASGHPEAPLWLAALFDGPLDRREEAKSLYERLACDGEVRAMFELGWMRWSEGDTDGARTAFEQALEAGEPRAQLEIGFLLADQDPDGEAPLVAFQRAQELGVEEAERQVGWQLARLGEVEEAEPVLRRAYEAGDLVAGDLLGDVLEALGRGDEAESVFLEVYGRAAAELSPDYRAIVARVDREDLYAEDLASWREEECDSRAPLALAALMFDAPRLAQVETTLKLYIESGEYQGPLDDLVELYEKTGRRRQAEALREHALDE